MVDPTIGIFLLHQFNIRFLSKYKNLINGIITPVRVNELLQRECFCMLYAQRVNLFGMMAVLCSYLRLVSHFVIF
jgi:hypothetical protein